jgi:protein-tyrosine kinase
MSVIENALKRLQGQRGAAAAAAADAPANASQGYGVSTGGAARRREAAAEAPAAPAPGRVVTIDHDALRAAGMLPPAHQEQELAQQYRRIKRPLINNALGRGVPRLERGNLLMITSAVPGEGKTFTSINLACSIQLEEDVTVLLVDGDVVNPRISQILGVDNELGLLDIVKDPTLSAEAAILPTSLPGLSFLPAGRQDINATELLASSRTHEVVSKLGSADPSRLVLFDSAPLLVTTESQALAHFAGQVLVVVRADQTPQHVLLDALGILAEDQPVFLLLNQTMRHSHAGYYYEFGVSAKPREPAGSA